MINEEGCKRPGVFPSSTFRHANGAERHKADSIASPGGPFGCPFLRLAELVNVGTTSFASAAAAAALRARDGVPGGQTSTVLLRQERCEEGWFSGNMARPITLLEAVGCSFPFIKLGFFIASREVSPRL